MRQKRCLTWDLKRLIIIKRVVIRDKYKLLLRINYFVVVVSFFSLTVGETILIS